MGRDHTIFAVADGYVRFYLEKWGNKTRRFVGLVLNPEEKLPRDLQAHGRSRFFGLEELNGVPAPTIKHAKGITLKTAETLGINKLWL